MPRKATKPKTSKLAKSVAKIKANHAHGVDPRIFESYDEGKPTFMRSFYCSRTHTYATSFTCAIGGCAKAGGKGCPNLCSEDARKDVFFHHVTKGKLPVPSHLQLYYDIKTENGEYEITFTRLADSGLRQPRMKKATKKPKAEVKPSSKIRKTKLEQPVAKKRKRKTTKTKATKTVAKKTVAKKTVAKKLTAKPKTVASRRKAAKKG